MNPSILITPNAVEEGTLFSIIPTDGSGDMTAVRATTATLVNSEGVIENVAINVPRLDYTNGSCPSILVEPQRTNLLLRSEEFENASWGTLGTITITPNNTIAPDGNNSADLILGADSVSSIFQTYSGSIGVVYTSSFFIKNNNSTQSKLLIRNASTVVDAILNWTGSVLSSITNTTGITTFKSYNNGWYRITSTYTSVEAPQRPRIYPTLSTNQSVFLWGAQLEAGSNATSYIPTVASAVTRNADVISKTGISDLIGQTEGTIYWDGNLSVNTSERRLLSIIGTAGESQRIIIWTLNNLLYTTFNGVGVNLGSFPIGTTKIAIGYTISGANTTYSIKVNNNTLVTGTAAAAPTSLSSIALGSQLVASLTLNDRINSTILWKERLTNDELATLTTV